MIVFSGTFVRWKAVLLTALALSAPVAFAQLPGGTWQYHWGDEFSGTALDSSKWHNGFPDWGMSTAAPTQIRQDHVNLGDGELTLKASRLSAGGAEPFAGGIISSYQKHNISGGSNYIEARILLPDTPGSWPAFWGLYTGWPPEADIMEYPIDTAAGSGYNQDQYHTAFHYSTGSGNAAGAGQVNPGSAGDLGGTYHNFGMEWREDDWVGFYFDGQRVSEFGNDAAIEQMQHMYLILNYAVGGWPGSPNTTEWPIGHIDETKVDWVRVWKSATAKTSDWNYTGPSENVQWDTAANWTSGAPNLGGVTSTFDSVSAGAQNVDLPGRRTLSVVNFDGSTRYRLGNLGDRLVLAFGNNGSLRPEVHVAATTTTEHEIAADLEFAGGLDLHNASSHPLRFTGSVMGGGGDVRVDGPGVVTFEGNNSYTATTLVGVGQGPGVALARGTNSFGVGGTVVIGDAGNNTTARIELENGAQVSNNLAFRGRHDTSSAAIVNNTGDNTISGTLNVEAGGATYLIRSDAGSLTLSGGTQQAGGVALTTGTGMGSRTVTLDGAGHGHIRGAIQNASGTTLAITKRGAGVWTLNGENTYSGTTSVTQGTLVVDGTTGFGATTVLGGATIGGRGTVRGNLTTQSNSTIRVGAAGLPLALPGGQQLIDDFEQYPTGQIGATPNTTSDRWTGVFDGTANAEIVDNAGDQALRVRGINAASGSWRGAITDLGGGYADTFDLAHGETGTYFFRVRRNGPGTIDTIFGLTDQQASTSSPPGSDIDTPWDEYAVLLSIFGDTNSSMLRAYSDGAGDVPVASANNGQWLNVWLTVDNANKSYRVATSTAAADGVDSGSVYQFGRRTAAVVGNRSLATFGFHESRFVGAELDDLYFVEGVELTNPLFQSPVPVSETLAVGGNLVLDGTTLELDLGEDAWDSVDVAGTAMLDGVLLVTLDPSYTPELNDTFSVLTASSITNNLTLGGPDGAMFSFAGSTGTELILTYIGGLQGDFNGDGVVNMADYTVWRDSLGATGSGLAADANDNMEVDSGDYQIWKSNFGSTDSSVLSAAHQIPEPSGAVVGCLVATMVAGVARMLQHQLTP